MTYGYFPPPPPSGWYPDPTPTPQYRWWSGAEWTAWVWPPREPWSLPGAVAGDASAAVPGTATVTYPAVVAGRPRGKWIGRFGGWIIVAGCVAIWAWLFGFSFLFDALTRDTERGGPPALDPYLLVTGSIAVAAALLYTMAYRLRPADGLTASRLVLIAVIGGTGATLLAIPVNTLLDIAGHGTSGKPSLLALGLAGVVEEFMKILLVLLLARRLPVKNARIGLFVGGAVGFGFSVIENLSYLQEAFATGAVTGNSLGRFLETTIARELTGPFLHPLFTALLAAAIFGAVRDGRFRLTFAVFGTYLAVAAAHGLFDTLPRLTAMIPGLGKAGIGLLSLLFIV
ncbi:MAG: PrsW family glutamic-type intramembrane protease, partial [Leifsonia sp.]